MNGPITFSRPQRPDKQPWQERITAGLLRFLVFLIDQPLHWGSWLFRAVIWVVFAIMGWTFLVAPLAPESVLGFWHYVNLPFHEAGHILFGFLPPVGVSFMGTGAQLLMPLICGLVLFFKTRDHFGASICLWWFGQNFLDIAPYIDDARRGTLPLLGNTTGQEAPYGFHDWQFILTEMGWIQHDQAIARAVWVSGKILMLLALAWGAAILVRAHLHRHENL